MKHVTIKDVAKAAGVGIATASRALNNKGEVSPETRERVLLTAKRLGYVPNSLARGLILGKTKKVGIIITTLINPFYATVVSGIESVLTSRGYTLALYNSNERPVKEKKAILTLREQRVEGLIFAPIEYDSESVRDLLKNQIPFVLVARRTIDEKVDYVVCDDFEVGKMATEYLISKGHKRILFLNSWKSSSAKFRYEGYKFALKEAGLSVSSKLVYSIDPDTKIEDILDDVLAQRKKPTAIFCFCDLMAIEVLKILRAKKIKVPEDIAMIGCDNLDFTEILDPPLTTIDIPKYEMGVTSAKILLEKLKDGKEVRQIVLKPKLVIRSSA